MALTFSIFIVQVLALYLISRVSITELFYLLRRILKNDHTVFVIISLIFLPGTMVHELSHFLMATVLLMRVREVTIIPTLEDQSIKLGRVMYEKKDFIRGFIVGIAPIFGGLVVFWWLDVFHLFPQQNVALNILLGFLIFSISTSMFSSQQDLVDAVFMIPIIAIIAGVIFLFKIDLVALYQANQSLFVPFENVLKSINSYAFVTICIHVLLIVLLKLLRFKFRYA